MVEVGATVKSQEVAGVGYRVFTPSRPHQAVGHSVEAGVRLHSALVRVDSVAGAVV